MRKEVRERGTGREKSGLELNINQLGKGRSSTEGPQKYHLTCNSTLRAISLHNYSSGKQYVMSRDMAVKE
jgi:hypothetical protein